MTYPPLIIGPETSWFHGIIEDYLRFVPFDIVLEVGCGMGYSVFKISKQVKKIVGIDISKPTIDFICEIYPIKNFLHFDICDERFSNRFPNVFTKSFSCDVLEHVTDFPLAIQNISKTMKHGGITVHTFPNSLQHGRNYFESKDKLIRIYEDAGFSISLYTVEMTSVYSFIWRWYRKIRKVAKVIIGTKPDTEYKYFRCDKDEFHEYSCFEINTDPKFYHIIIRAFIYSFMELIQKNVPNYLVHKDPQDITENRILIYGEKI